VVESSTKTRKVLPVEIDLIAPIRPVPERLFFGTLTRGRPVEKTLTLLLSSDLIALSPDDVRIKHDLGGRLDVRCSRSPAPAVIPRSTGPSPSNSAIPPCPRSRSR
jgi:hypothetical protein